MKKFFRKLGRWLRKIWEVVKKVIAVILVAIILVVAVTALVAVFSASVTLESAFLALSNVTSGFLAWVSSITGSANLALMSTAVKGFVAMDWAAAGALSYAFGFLALPSEMEWAVRRATSGLRYIGTQVVDAVGDIGEEVVNEAGDLANATVRAVTSSPLLLLGVGFLAYSYFRNRPGGQISEVLT